MTKRLQREIEKLKQRILLLGARVEESLSMAVRSFAEQDRELARKVIEGDTAIDEMEVDLEEECLKILALYQPVAVDLRFIVAVLKINNDLERIGDLAANMAHRTCSLTEIGKARVPAELLATAGIVQHMLSKSLDALVNMDSKLALQVWHEDDLVDDAHRAMFQRVEEGIRQNIDDMEWLIHLLSASRYLERIADQTTNIAEDVIYLVQGDVIRHRVAVKSRSVEEENT